MTSTGPRRSAAGEAPAPPDRTRDDVVSRLSVVLGRLQRILRRTDPSGLGPGSISTLATVVRTGPLRLGDLAHREGVAPPTVTRIVAGLEELGLLTREADPDDGRAMRVQATDAGRDAITGVSSNRFAALSQRVAGLPPEEQDVLRRAIGVLESLAADE